MTVTIPSTTVPSTSTSTPDPIDWSTYTIARLSPGQNARGIATHYREWGAGFTLDAYTQRVVGHYQSAAQPWGAAGGCVAWGLVRRGEEGMADAEVFAFCTTYRRAAICSTHGRVTSYGIAAVVTPPANRKKGYARHMLRLLHYVLAPRDLLPPFPAAWGAQPTEHLGDAHFSVLFSGIGKDYYATCTVGEQLPGWVFSGMQTRVWDVKDIKGVEEVEEEEQEGWTWLDLQGILDIEPEMDRRIGRDISSSPTSGKPRIAILPAETGLAKFMTQMYLQSVKPTPHAGLVLPAPEGGEAPFIIYQHFPLSNDPETPSAQDLGLAPPDTEEEKARKEAERKKVPRRLAIGHVSHGRDAAGNLVPFPFAAAVAVARREGCTSIEHWGPTAGWDAEGGGARMEDKDNIPCIARYAGDEEWAYCEKYTWC